MTENINEYMNFFKQQSLNDKQNIIYEQLRTLASFTNHLCAELEIPNDILVNKELLDLKKDNYSEDDFLEAIVVLINSIQNSICDYASGISKLLDETIKETS